MSESRKQLCDIPGFDGRYGITDDGRIWIYPRARLCPHCGGAVYQRHRGIWLKPDAPVHGYARATLQKIDGKKRHYSVHRLVAMTWIPNPNRLPIINHINGVKHDNRAENLEWCDQSHNRRHAHAMGLIAKDTPQRRAIRQKTMRKVGLLNRKLTREQAEEVRALRSSGLSWSALARRFNLNSRTIRSIVNGRTYTD